MPCSIVFVLFNHSKFVFDCAFRHFLGLGRVRIRNTHRQTQLQRVSKLNPLLNVSAIYKVCARNQSSILIFGQRNDCAVQFVEKRIIHLFLRIIRHCNLSFFSNLRIRNRSIRICNTAHCSDLDHHSYRIRNRILRCLGNEFHSVEIRIQLRDNPVAYQKHASPVIRCIEISNR